jgi:hypothetical protein
MRPVRGGRIERATPRRASSNAVSAAGQSSGSRSTERIQYSAGATMRSLNLNKIFTLMESGPVFLVATSDGKKNNIMTISWAMVMDFTPRFTITTDEWNYSFYCCAGGSRGACGFLS